MIPVPAFLIKWVGEKLAKAIAAFLAVMLVIGLLAAIYYGVKTYFTADLTARVKVISGQLDASGKSGSDAVQSVGNAMENEAVRAEITEENTDAITKSDGANVVVAPAVRDAGLHAFCRRKSYRDAHPECVQRAAK